MSTGSLLVSNKSEILVISIPHDVLDHKVLLKLSSTLATSSLANRRVGALKTFGVLETSRLVRSCQDEVA